MSAETKHAKLNSENVKFKFQSSQVAINLDWGYYFFCGPSFHLIRLIGQTNGDTLLPAGTEMIHTGSQI